jgi:tetratricopeptide (TPR) repeat protein
MSRVESRARVHLFLWGSLASLVACGPPAPRYEEVPEWVSAPTQAPPMPTDTARPFERVRWVLNYDMREFDATLTWLREEVPEGPERDRAIGTAALLGAFELDRSELADEGIAAFDAAIAAFPEDARLPVWRGALSFVRGYAAGDRAAVGAAYDELRDAAGEYVGFSSFGLTLTIAADRFADDALLEEASEQYQLMNESFNNLQYDDTVLADERASRLSDWAAAPYNMSGTSALIGDIEARRGNFEEAQVHYYTALNANSGYRWPWRDEVQRRMDDAEALSQRLRASPAQDSMLGVRFVGATGIDAPYRDPRFDGRIGNGSCTLCHTHMNVFDDGEELPELGWIRGTYVAPEGVPNAIPIFFALPDEPEPIPGSFLIGRVAWTGDEPAPGIAPGDVVEWLMPAPPGNFFVAGQIFRGNEVAMQGYTAKELGMLRTLEVRANEVTDITDSEPMQFSPVE